MNLAPCAAIGRTVGHIRLYVQHEGRERDELGGFRQAYTYKITETAGGDAPREYVGNDIRSGVGAEIDARAMLGTLVSFALAAVEAREAAMHRGVELSEVENADLFPGWVTDLFADVSDELQILALELEDAQS